jgi:hypothetical protein
MASNHNGMLRMYETFGNGGANTMHRRVGGGPDGAAPAGRGGGQTTREWYRPVPPYREVDWSMRNNTNYSQTGVLSALQLTAAFPQIILENFYKKSRNSIESGKKDAPYGYVIPFDQDHTRVAFVINTLRTQGIEVGSARSEVKLKEGTYPAGSWIVKRDQPYGRLAKILLEKQEFPDPNLTTYDDTGWTMGLMTHSKIVESADKAVLDIAVEPVDKFRVYGRMTGSAGAAGGYVVIENGSNNLITLRYRLKDISVRAVEQPFKSGDQDVPAGSLIFPANSYEKLKAAIEPLGLKAVALNAAATVPMHDVDLPRLAVYSTWGSTQEVGWVRHAFDHFEIPFDLIYKERVKKGNLRASYDVIVIPNQGRGSKGLVYDIDPKSKPVEYKKSESFKNLGVYGESDDITGGMGLEGVVELQKFVDQGGLMVTLGSASWFPADFGITRKVEATRTSPQFYAPGPIVQAEIVRPVHPVFYGYSEKTIPVRWANGPLLTVPTADREQQVLMRFPGGDGAVLSGLMKGANEVRGRPAILDVPVGQGRVLMFATNPVYRWQNYGEFNMLFNAVMHFNDFKAK